MMIFAYNLELSSAKYMYSDILTIIRGGSGGVGGGGGRPPKIGKNMIFWRKIVIFHT